MKDYEIRMAVYEHALNGRKTVMNSRINEKGEPVDDEPRMPFSRLATAMQRFLDNYSFVPYDGDLANYPSGVASQTLRLDTASGAWKLHIDVPVHLQSGDNGYRRVEFVIPLGQHGTASTQQVIRFARRFSPVFD